MTEKKDAWGSTLGFILASLGMAIGTGNVWRFPRMTAAYGGGPFIFAWIVALFVWSIPLLMAECVIGKKTRCAHPGGFRDFMGKKWAFLGTACAIILVMLAAYYSVIVGYCLKYLVNSATGVYGAPITLEQATAMWDTFRSSPGEMIVFHAIAMGISTLVLYFGIQAGVERVCKVAIPGLFFILIGMTIYIIVAFDPAKVAAGYEALFHLDFTALSNSRIWIEAFTQSAWSTGAGWGLLYIYSTRLPENSHVGNNGISVGTGDQLGALVSATVVIPALFALSADPSAAWGAGNFGLTFIYVSQLFSTMTVGSNLFAFLFFLVLSAAGITSMFAMVEVGAANMENVGVGRKKAVIITGFALFAIGIPSAIWPAVCANQDWVCGIGLLLAGLLYALAIIKHGPKKVLDEYINTPEATRIYRIGAWWKVLISLFPVIFAVIVGWWLWQSMSWYETPWNPLLAESTGTVVFQLLAVMLISFLVTGGIMKRAQKGPLSVDE